MRRSPGSHWCSCRPCRVRSPSGASAFSTAAVPFETGRLSPVSADSATSSVAAREQPAVGRDDVAGLDRDDVAGDELLGRQLGQARRPGARCALTIIIFCSAATAAAALPSWRRPRTALKTVRKMQQDAGAELLERVEAPDPGRPGARSASDRRTGGGTRASAARPWPPRTCSARTAASRFAASSAVSPRSGSTPSRCATSSPLRVNQIGASVAATPSGSFTAPDGSITRS